MTFFSTGCQSVAVESTNQIASKSVLTTLYLDWIANQSGCLCGKYFAVCRKPRMVKITSYFYFRFNSKFHFLLKFWSLQVSYSLVTPLPRALASFSLPDGGTSNPGGGLL